MTDVHEMEVNNSPQDEICHRLVHLDLKGAPPKLPFYEKWGATGLLIEYEDMFPYSGALEKIAAPFAYSRGELQTLLKLAEANQLTVIPLIQTYGHFEFVLKHEQWWGLREVPEYPLTLCPLNTGSLDLVGVMLEQVVSLHPNSKTLHIGADEVYHIGCCARCMEYMSTTRISPPAMFLKYIHKVLRLVKDRYPDHTVIMWDDMFREVDFETIAKSGICGLVEPMVWQYHNSISLPPNLWDRYSCVFDSVWVASAYKGATGPCMFVTDIGYHIENHRGWQALEPVLRHKFSNFRGYALTGWQRYDHYSILCELLPVALPSLAICLLMLKIGAFTEDVHQIASADLRFKQRLPLVPFHNVGEVSECEFPGSDVYQQSQKLLSLISNYKLFLVSDRFTGWMSSYHVRHKYCNPAHIRHFLPQAEQLLQASEDLQKELKSSLADVFYADTVEEFISVNFDEMTKKLQTIIDDARGLLAHGAHPKQISCLK